MDLVMEEFQLTFREFTNAQIGRPSGGVAALAILRREYRMIPGPIVRRIVDNFDVRAELLDERGNLGGAAIVENRANPGDVATRAPEAAVCIIVIARFSRAAERSNWGPLPAIRLLFLPASESSVR